MCILPGLNAQYFRPHQGTKNLRSIVVALLNVLKSKNLVSLLIVSTFSMFTAIPAFADVDSPLLEYRFEETRWDGAAGEILDSSGNGHHASVNNNAILATVSPALTGTPGTCGYTSQNDGSIAVTGLPLNTTSNGVKTTVTFWMNWDGTDNVMPIGWNFHDIWIRNGSIGFNTWSSDVYGTSSAGLANGWHHIAVEFTNGSVTSNRMYIDGVEQVLTQRFGSPTNSRAFVNSQMRVGGVANSTSYDFHGLLDEVRVYQGTLTTAEVLAVMNARHPCIGSPVIEYYFDELSWDGTPNEVLNNIGNANHGTAFGDTTTVSTGQVCSAGTFDGTGDYIDASGISSYLNSTASISFWMKSDQSGNNSAWNAPGILGVEERGGGDDIFWGTIDASGHLRIQKGNGSFAVSSTVINDSSWHHVVLTWDSASGVVQVYVNGNLEDTANSETGDVGSPFSSIGRIENSFSSVNYTGQLDELMVFDSIISPSQVSDIYSNQLNGDNYDGSARVCPVPPVPLIPIVDYRFDECSYAEAPGEVIDQTGNFSANSNNVPSPVDEAIINKSLDLSADGTDDWIHVPSNVVDGLDDFSLAVWFKTSSDKSQQEIFQALGSSSSDDELEIYLKDDDKVVIKIKGSSQELNSNVELTNNNWHHLVVTRASTEVCLFIDGVEQECGSSVTGVLSVPNANATVIGQEQDSFGGNFSTSQNFIGLLDEFKIFSSRISADDIDDIYQNELAGNNYDASIRDAVQCDDFCSINSGTLNAVGIKINGSGSDSQINTTTEGLAIYSAWLAAGSPATGIISGGTYNVSASGTSTVDRVDFGGSEHDFSGTLPYPGFADGVDGSHFLVHASGKLSLPAGDYTIFVESDDGFSFLMDTVSGDTVSFNKFGSSNSGASNELRFELPTGNSNTGGSFTLTQDSVFDIATIFFERTGGDYLEISIANNIRTNSAPSGYEILRHGALGGKVNFGCTAEPQIHHFEILHDGSGLTCAAETVTVKVCIDDSCANLSTESVTLDFLVDGALISAPTFTGSTDISFNNTDVETVTLSVANATVSASDPVVCDDGVGASCNMVFSNAGFRFLYGDSNSETLPNQVSGTVFPEELKLQALKDNNGVCEGIFTGSNNIDLSQQNVAPTTPAGLDFTINGSSIAKHPSFTNTGLNFGADSIAIIPTPIYHDAGQIRLHANYNVGGISLTGSSDPFWVSPAELVVSATSGSGTGSTVLNGASSSAGPTHAAGENFTLTVSAKNSLGVVTPNYSPGQIELKLERTGPTPTLTGSVNGDLTYAAGATLSASVGSTFQDVTLTNFSSGVSTFNGAQYSEVGLLNLDVQDSNYGNVGITIPAEAINIGRFIPAYFIQTVKSDGILNAKHTLAGDCSIKNWAYSAQKTDSKGTVTYNLMPPEILITAYNVNNIVTKNYTVSDYMKLNPDDIDVREPTADFEKNRIDPDFPEEKIYISSKMTFGIIDVFAPGVVRYTFNEEDNFTYEHNAHSLYEPFPAKIPFTTTRVEDDDLVMLYDGIDPAISATERVISEGVEIRFGRLVLENSFGPETSNLPQPMQIEYFDGTNFIVNSDEGCATYDASNISLNKITDGLDLADTNAIGGTGDFLAGKTRTIELTAPGAGNTGEVGVVYSTFEWLKFDWGNTRSYDQNPSAIATFGLYRGNDRIISWREINN